MVREPRDGKLNIFKAAAAKVTMVDEIDKSLQATYV